MSMFLPPGLPSQPPERLETVSTGAIWAKLIVVVVLCAAGGVFRSAVLGLLAIWALGGPRRAIEALILSWLVTSLNPGLFAPAPGAAVFRWAILGAASISIGLKVLRDNFVIPRALAGVCLFVSVSALAAMVSSYALDVSLFKLTTFLAGAFVVLVGFFQTRHQAAYWTKWIECVTLLLLAGGLLFLFHPIGYFRNARGFQGLLNHPQAYAIFLAPVVAASGASLITANSKRWPAVILIVAAGSLLASQARTGALAAAIGLIVPLSWWAATRRLSVNVSKPVLAVALFATVGTSLLLVRNGHEVAAWSQAFIVKGQINRDLDDAFYASRGDLMEASYKNFLRFPISGIGFGLPSTDRELEVKRDRLLGLPISAPAEKGVLFVAVLEETGAAGAIAFCIMIGMCLRPVYSATSTLPVAALATSAILTNFGEATLFSFGGPGLFIWLLIGYARIARGQPCRT